MTAIGIGNRAIESQMLLEILQRRLADEGLDEKQVEAVVALGFQRARETTISPLESITKSLEKLRERRQA